MHRFTYDEAKVEMSRREEGLRRAQRNGSAYEYCPPRKFSFAWPWRRAERPCAEEAPAPRFYEPA
jgi:hypothetical protein